MSFLTINGIALPVAKGSLKVSAVEVGERGESWGGTPFNAIRRVKYKRSFRLTKVSQAEAAALKFLLSGQGVTFGFAADLYSDQGHPVEDSLEATLGTGAVDFAAEAGAFIEWDLSSSFGANATFFVWCDGDIMAYRTSGEVFHNGVEDGGGWTGKAITFGITAGVFRVDNNTSNAVGFGPVLALPGELTDDLIAGLSNLAAYPVLPKLTLSGDAVSAATTVVGAVTGCSVVAAKIGGVFVANAEELEVELVEV